MYSVASSPKACQTAKAALKNSRGERGVYRGVRKGFKEFLDLNKLIIYAEGERLTSKKMAESYKCLNWK